MGDYKKIGIVGGMGPLAAVRLFDRIVERTDASHDSEHIRIFIDNNPSIPDRTEAVLHGGASPVPAVCESINTLQRCGADFILLACNTLHYFYDEIVRETGADVVNMIAETGKLMAARGITRVGLLSTTGTIGGRVFEKYLNPLGITVLTPDLAGQETVMKLIYDGVKAGADKYDTTGFMNVARELRDRGAQTLIAGCTDISVALERYSPDLEVTDALEVLAEAAVVKAGYKLRG